jgi:MoaA/NifB/PqqE/SkfB family radical SAM enzyme
MLMGSATDPAQVRHSAYNLTSAGVAFSIQAVVTRLNPRSVRAVAAFAADAGAKVLQVEPFEPVAWPIGGLSNDAMSLEDYKGLNEEVALLTQWGGTDRLAAEVAQSKRPL